MDRTSQIIICEGINVDREYSDVLDYTEEQMVSLCREHAIASANNYSFIRKSTNTVAVDFSYADCIRANYIAFQNTDYSSKWFFGWIDEVKYISDHSVEIRYTIDAWSTWFSYWNTKSCYVLREHVNDDTIGLHTLPENLAVGEVVQEAQFIDLSFQTSVWIGILSSWLPEDGGTGTGKQFAGINVYNKQLFGKSLLLFEYNVFYDPVTGEPELPSDGSTPCLADVMEYLGITTNDGHIADVSDMFILPDGVIDQSKLELHTADRTYGQNHHYVNYYTLKWTLDGDVNYPTDFPKIHSFSDYTPKNNKCFCYPYNYLLVSNNNGNQNIFKYELFSDPDNATFINRFALSIGCSSTVTPTNYKGMPEANDESIPLGKYPVCGWSADSYTNWLTQQAVNMPMRIANIATGGLMGGYQTNMASKQEGATVSGTRMNIASNIINTMNQVGSIIGDFYSASLMPNVEGGGNTGDVNYSANKNGYVFRAMRCKTEYLKQIDDYFSRFGYVTNLVKVPNITGRRYWNYVQIGGSEIIGTGNVPEIYMDSINRACRNGTTIWHNHANIGNYNLDNVIV